MGAQYVPNGFVLFHGRRWYWKMSFNGTPYLVPY